MSEQPEHPDPPPNAHPSPADHRKGAFISGGTFHKDVIGYQEINVPPPPPPMPLAEALPLLASLPTGDDDPIPAPQTLPDPHRIILSPNPLFVGRAHDLRTLAARLKAGESIAVTTGIGGVGKTQLAVELAHRYGRYFGGGVFWLSCADPAGIAAEVAACGRTMGLYRDAEQLTQDEQVARVRAAWASELPRLLIFDNCEEEAILRTWKPTTGASRVLVTSRRATWSATLGVTTQPLDVLPLPESVALLRKHCPALAEAEAEAISEELGRLPLPLHLAGHFLARYSAITPAAYLAKLRSPALLEHPSLVGRGVQDMPTEREPHVARAFALSFERLDASDEIDALALALLARAACLAPSVPFPRDLLVATVEIPSDEAERELAVTDALDRLVGLGLLEQDGEQLRLHRLLAAYTQNILRDDDALPVVEWVVNCAAARANETKVPQVMQPTLPHLRHLVQQADKREDNAAATLCNNLGFYLNMVGAYGDALPLYKRVLAISERVLGSDHPQTAWSLNNLAYLFQAQGAYEQARPLYERALAIQERVLGSDHPQTAACLNNLALLHHAQGAYGRALPLLERALAVRERVLGSDHPDTATSLNNLAGLHRAQGEDERALPLLERALAISERVLGSDHPNTAACLNNLAGLHRAQGENERALPLFERALAISERVLGSNHPNTATSLNNLAEIYRAQEDYERALLLYERTLAIQEQVLGSDHPHTTVCLNNLAALHYAQGAYERALPLLKRALAVRERVLGSDHPDTATSLNNLAGLYEAQGAYERALPLFERALAIQERVLGSDHPQTAACLNNLAGLYEAQGEDKRALLLYERALAIQERAQRSNHPDTAQSLNNLARLYEAQGAYERALSLYERTLALRERVLGSDHPDTAQSLNNLGVLHAYQGHFALAFPLLERAIRIWQARLGLHHPNTVQAQQNLAAMRRVAVAAELPNAVRVALQSQDEAAFQQALQALPLEQVQAVAARLQAIVIQGKPLEQYTPLLQAIAAVAQGDERPRVQVKAALAQLEQHGFHLTSAVSAIWSGQRDLSALAAGCNATTTELIHRILVLLDEMQEQHAALFARAKAAVAAVGPDPAARAALAERLRAAADAYVHGEPAEWALAARLQALAREVDGVG
ncbi:MAG TPA: tetratricopeptide repeat protein [Roseiflexaceae bacterium]|nr:tetratricopeptide repeat protein [Roseiflexaceae bacterium]